MKLLDLYTEAVAKKLPKRQRADVAAEIRSTIEDMLADRALSGSEPASEALLVEVLREYGSPEQVAATYRPERYLIGPQLYPIFILVIKVVFTVLSVLALVGLGIGFASGPAAAAEIARMVAKALGQYFSGLMAAFGNIVLVFAVLERVLPEETQREAGEPDETWDPADLLADRSPDEISLWEPILAILFNSAALLIFNVYPQVLRYTPSLNDWGSEPIVWIPILSDAFFSYLPLLNLLWLATIVLNLLLVRRPRWNTGTRIFSISLKAFTIYILVMMLRGPSILNMSPEALAVWPEALEGVKILTGMFQTLIRVILYLAVFGTGVDIIKESYRLITRPGTLNRITNG